VIDKFRFWERGRGWAFKGIHMANISRTLKSIALTAWHCLKNEPKESSQERKVDRIRDTSAGAWEGGFPRGQGVGVPLYVCQLHSFDLTWLPIVSVQWKISGRRHWKIENKHKTNKPNGRKIKIEMRNSFSICKYLNHYCYRFCVYFVSELVRPLTSKINQFH